MAHMTGTASFTRRAGLCRYAEEGELCLVGGGTPVAFSRSYLYGAWEQGLDIRFDDDTRRLFQRIALADVGGALAGEGHHDCAPDTYRSRYRFALPGGFDILHAVTGPRKDHVIASRYESG